MDLKLNWTLSSRFKLVLRIISNFDLSHMTLLFELFEV